MCERTYTASNTASNVAEIQHIAAFVAARKRIHALIAKRKELPLTEYGSGFIDGLEIALDTFQELTPVVRDDLEPANVCHQ